MIKRLVFVRKRRVLSTSEFEAAWIEAVGLAAEAPAGARPARLAVCTTVHVLVDPRDDGPTGTVEAAPTPRRADEGTEPPHDGIAIAWFADVATLEQFEVWWRSAPRMATGLVEPAASLRIVADEVVMRGADWLERRWTSCAVKLKHMALARRARGSSPAEFAHVWRNRAGRIGGAGPHALTIPEAARGRAYVQNHPLLREDATAEWPYDAINEVYFDDLESMRPRLQLFREHDVLKLDADLVSQADFLVVRERVLPV